jgi:hypothetical protein
MFGSRTAGIVLSDRPFAEIALTVSRPCGLVTAMFTSACANAFAAHSGARVRAMAAPAVLDASGTWYVPTMGDISGFGHKRPARRPPSLT